MQPRFLAAGLLALTLGSGAAAATVAPRFGITLVDALPGYTDNCFPNGINDRGQIVGGCGEQAWLWTPGAGIRELVAGPGFATTADAINTAGKVTGRATRDFQTQAYFWDPALGFQLLGGLDPDRPHSEPYAINDADQIVGESISAAPDSEQRPFVWTAAQGMQQFARSPRVKGVAYDVNKHGVAAGGSGSTPRVAFRIGARGATSRLPPPSANQGVGAYAINDPGQVVGYLDAFSSNVNRAVLWSASGQAKVLDRRALAYAFSMARDINNAAEVVGIWRGDFSSTPFYWTSEHGMLDLQALLDPADPLTPSVTLFVHSPRINNAGQITVSARVEGKLRTLLLTPLPAR